MYKKRVKRIQSALEKVDESAILVLSSASEFIRTRDQHYPYRQNSDFYYATGSQEKNIHLILSTKHKVPLLLVPPKDKQRALWDGDQGDYKKIAVSLGAELITVKDLHKDLLGRIKNHSCLLYQNHPGSMSFRIASELMTTPPYRRGNYPHTFLHSDVILEPMRLHKEPDEIKRIIAAAEITTQAIHATASLIQPSTPEYIIARTIEYWFGLFRGQPAFGTIAATGKNAAVLHYKECSSTLKAGDLLLIDCGAELDMYNADITRVFPVSGTFSKEQKLLYEIVLKAQHAAIRKVKHGVLIKSVYDAAAKVLTEGLVELKVLHGKVSKLLEKKAYKLYFPHGIGHSLGLDVHDVGNHRGNNDARLSAGMVFTIEPGLYFPKAAGILKPCGIRIEDDVLVTKNGCEVLTAGMEKSADEVEQLLLVSISST